MALKGCLFDMDGVLVDSAKHHFVAWKRLADELSIPFTEEDNHALKGLSRVDSLEHILRLGNMELNEATKLKLMNHKNEWYLDLIKGMRKEDILPGAAELIQELSDAGIGVGLGSSSKNAQLILDNVELSGFFKVVVDGNHITLSKPDPEVFLKGAQGLGVQPAECIVFEDAAAGVEAAKAGDSLQWASATPRFLGLLCGQARLERRAPARFDNLDVRLIGGIASQDFAMNKYLKADAWCIVEEGFHPKTCGARRASSPLAMAGLASVPISRKATAATTCLAVTSVGCITPTAPRSAGGKTATQSTSPKCSTRPIGHAPTSWSTAKPWT